MDSSLWADCVLPSSTSVLPNECVSMICIVWNSDAASNVTRLSAAFRYRSSVSDSLYQNDFSMGAS